MKKLLFLFLLLTFSFALAEENFVKVTPAKPKINDIISITYHCGAENARLKNCDKMVLYVVFWKPVEDYVFKQIPMLKDGDYFTANLTVPNDSVVYITFKFGTETAIDDNNLQWWEIFLHNEKGIELEGSHYQKALSSLFSYDLSRKMETTTARKELEKEIELYPENIFALQTKWLNDIKMSNGNDSVVKDVQEKLRTAYNTWKNDEEATHYIAYAADYAKMDGLTSVIKDFYSLKSPKGKVIRLIRYFEAIKEKDVEKKVELLKKFLADFDNVDLPTKDIILANLYDAYLSKQNNEGIREIFAKYIFNDIYYYINIGEAEFNNAANLKEYSLFLDPILEQVKNTTTKDKPPYMTDLTFLRDLESKTGILSALKGRVLFELRDTLAALPHLDIYYRSTAGERGDYNSLYVECLTKAKRYDDALKVCSEIIRSDRFMPGIEKYYENVYVNVKGTKDGFEAQLKSDYAERRKTQKIEMTRSKINKKAPDFILKDLDGKTVKLSELKGKVVIIDFWAIWCGPCRTSLPYFQQAYEKYKNDKNVSFLAINTWERTPEGQRESSVKSFISSNNYSFPVLYDDSTKFVERLGVESIPTKFAIDPDGNVQFMSVGFNGPDEMMTEIDLWIEILRRKN